MLMITILKMMSIINFKVWGKWLLCKTKMMISKTTIKTSETTWKLYKKVGVGTSLALTGLLKLTILMISP